MKKTVFVGAALGFLMMFGPTPASATITIDFSTAFGTGGTVNYAGGVAPLVGTNLAIGLLNSTGTPSNPGVNELVFGACPANAPGFLHALITSSGCLNFTTGNLISAAGGVDTFGPGGSITIVGSTGGCATIGGCGTGTPNVTAGPLLLTGQVVSATFNTNGGAIKLTITSGTDTKDSALLAYYGLPPGGQFEFGPGTVHSTLTAPPNAITGAFTSTSTDSTDIPNTVIPEPTSILLLGTVLVGVARLTRRRQVNKA